MRLSANLGYFAGSPRKKHSIYYNALGFILRPAIYGSYYTDTLTRG